MDIPSQYPDPEVSQMQNSAWFGENQSEWTAEREPNEDNTPHLDHSNTNAGGLYSSNENAFQRDAHGSLNIAMVEFESSSSRQRAESRELSTNPDFLLEEEASGEEEISDADSDYFEFQADISKLKEDVRRFRASRIIRPGGDEDESSVLGSGSRGARGRRRSGQLRTTGRGGRGRGRGSFRGPRKAAEPTGDIKLRLGKASEAFIAEDYIEARAIVSEVIRINAETYEAWTMLASIFEELGDLDNALMALMYAAHLRPKDVSSWFTCAQFALQETGVSRAKNLVSAQFCYSSAIRADGNNVDARFGKAAIYVEQGNFSLAISEYKAILTRRPHDTLVLRHLAEAYIDQDDAESAKEFYKKSITHFMSFPNASEQPFGWSDLNTYIELYGYLRQYDAAIVELKRLARWLLGRGVESFWDTITSVDCEWDADSDRRAKVPGFTKHRFPMDAFGIGLPMELRVKLGLYRLSLGQHEEAVRHLNWLNPKDEPGLAKVFDYPELCRQVADELLEAGLHQVALEFYQPLRQILEQNTASLYVQMGKCYLGHNLQPQAEECFHTAIQVDEFDIDARMQLAKIYEDTNNQERAFIFVNEIISLKRTRCPKVTTNRPRAGESGSKSLSFVPAKGPRSYKRRQADPKDLLKEEAAKAEQLQLQYMTMRREHEGMRNENAGSTQAWMEAAKDLIEDFRGFKTFYPWDKYVRFLGYTDQTRFQAETPLDADLASMASRLSRNLGADIKDRTNALAAQVPADYRGISFSAWLDIFVEYAICLAKNGRSQESYEICEAAKDAIVYCHSREDIFLIHVCWCTCALLSNDEETCVNIARFFMRDYQFTTDSYRMFSAVTRMCQSPVSWYSSGPTQKYMLRQIKAMDFSLVDRASRDKYFGEKGSYSAQDEQGNVIINDDLDIALLMLYGHILYTGSSYIYALNYFLRAYALDSGNPVINLNIGLAYIHHALKRQAENRQHLILQGLTFLYKYYDSRKQSSNVEERLEANFNVARAYHMIGLTHLAILYYLRVLQEVTDVDQAMVREDLVLDAAFNLQTMYAMVGNHDLAYAITERWLVI